MIGPTTALGTATPASWPIEAARPAGTAAPTGRASFQELLLQSLEQVNSAGPTGQTATAQSVIGAEFPQVEALSGIQKVDLALKMLVQVRDRALEAYNEVKQMQV